MSRVTKAVLETENGQLRHLLAQQQVENDQLRKQLRRYTERSDADIANDLRRVFANYADAAAMAKDTAIREHRSVRVVRCSQGFEVMA